MNPDPLLEEVLGPDDARMASSLSRTLRAARGRRRLRQGTLAAAVMAVLCLADLLLWHRLEPRRAASSLAVTTGPAPADSVRPVYDLVHSAALPSSLVLETRPNPAAVSLATQPGATVEWINDDQLLALAPGCLALTRSVRGTEFVALCDDLIGSP
ncbi:MAG: hypothetical protein KF791_07015 [Verrucomicrobiae bacterium]|nr:hypothetical protein [Verrucomicrobiae bacterium]